MKKIILFSIMACIGFAASAQIVVTQTQAYTYKEPYSRAEGLFVTPYFNAGLPFVTELGLGIGWQFNKYISFNVGLGWNMNKIVDKPDYRYAFSDYGGPFQSCENKVLNTLPLYVQATFYTHIFSNFPLFISGHLGIANSLTTLHEVQFDYEWGNNQMTELQLTGGFLYGLRAGFSLNAFDIYFVGNWFSQHYEEAAVKDNYYGIGFSYHIPFDASKLLGN